MTQQTSGYTAPAGSPATDPPTTQVARDQAGQVARTATDAGRQVAGTAAEQAGQVAQEAKRQARDLLGEARGQATDQARNGQQKATESLRSLAGELHQMADGGDRQGPASELAKQAADRVGDVADWLNNREPGELLDEFRSMARRRPGAFLIGAAVAGVLAGRLTRGAVDANRDTSGPRPGTVPPVSPAFPAQSSGIPAGYPAQPAAAVPYDAPGTYDAPRTYDPAPVFAPTTGHDPATTYDQPRFDATPGYDAPAFDPTPSSVPTPPQGIPDDDAGAHTPRPGTTPVGEYVQDLESGDVRRTGDDPYPGGSR